MITWDQFLLDCQDFTQDYSAASLLFFKRKGNQGYKKILAEFGTQQNEKTQTSTTVASQQFYQVPFDLIVPKSITVTIGTIAYPVTWIESQEQWDFLNANSAVTSNIPQRAFYRPRFGVNGGDIGLWPTPSASGSTITLVYVASDKDMAQTAYVTGTAAVTLNSPTVTGTGTTFIPQMIGRYFNITDATGDGLFYRIVGVPGSTSLTLEQNFEGVTTSGAAYQVAEVFALPEEMQIIPEYFALWHYYIFKQNDKKMIEYRTLFQQELQTAKSTWSKKVRDNIIRTGPTGRMFANTYPINFPQSGISS